MPASPEHRMETTPSDHRLMLIGVGVALMLVGFLMILVSNLQTVTDFQTFPWLLLVLGGAGLVNRELFSPGCGQLHVGAIASLLLGVLGFSIVGAPISVGRMTSPLVVLFSLGALVAGMGFLVLNYRNGGVLHGNKLASTGVSLSLVCLLPASVVLFYDPGGHFQRAEAYFTEKNYAQAIVEYDKAIAQEPQSLDAYCKRAWAYLHLQEYDRAWEDIKNVDAKFTDFYSCPPELIAELQRASRR